jgi:hypothetical protein
MGSFILKDEWMKRANGMHMSHRPGLATVVLVVGLGLGMNAEAVADVSPQNMSLTTPNMSAAVMVKNVLHNTTAPAQFQKMTTPASPAKTVAASGVKAEAVGRVVWVKGTFTASLKVSETTEAPRPLEKSSVIYLHDMLETGKQSEAQIVFSDNTLMTFRPASKFYIDQYEYHPNAQTKSVGKYIMNLLEGGFRTITGIIAKANPSDYQVNTPVATIGVRGTDYTLVIKDKGIYLARNEGEPCVSNEAKNLCLNMENKYAEVASPGATPVYMVEPPAFLVQPIVIEPATYTELGGSPVVNGVSAGGSSVSSDDSSVSSGDSGSTVTTTTTTEPTVTTPSSDPGGSGASDFCIR